MSDAESMPNCVHCGGTGMEVNDYGISEPCIFCEGTGISDQDHHEPIRCPQCKSTNWRCWDERSFECWDADGHQVGNKIVGYLTCRDCGASWTDTSLPCPEGSDCEDD